MMEVVNALASMVGMQADTAAAPVAKKHLHKLELPAKKAVITQAKAAKKPTPQSKSSSNKAEEIFPLSEDDLKEF